MKKFTLLFALLLAATCNFAQASQAFNYQAVICDAAGKHSRGDHYRNQNKLIHLFSTLIEK